MSPRESERRKLAETICKMPSSWLMQFGLARVADLTGLDTIGLPVYTACRPSGTAITISAGKGLTQVDAKAGAILESIEVWASENPQLHPSWVFCSHAVALNSFANVLPFDLFQLARDSPVNQNTPLEFDEMEDVFRQKTVLVPSDMIWLTSRTKPLFQYFQASSNGLAAGISVRDAILQAVYEVIERDGWSIAEVLEQQTGQWQECISLDCWLPPSLQICVDHLKSAGVTPFLFNLTRDISVPIFRCNILDDSDRSPGLFAGFGCSLDPVTAARRAITEACQSRAAYIGGARDDLFRRRFLLMKNINMKVLLRMYQSLPQPRAFSAFSELIFDSVDEEWETLCSQLEDANITELYSKILYTSDDPKFCIVKVVCPELECPIFEHWAMGQRTKEAVSRPLEPA
jgi:YcaO-like protein with predicted kinase domain